jgi:hypothetical protein
LIAVASQRMDSVARTETSAAENGLSLRHPREMSITAATVSVAATRMNPVKRPPLYSPPPSTA